MMLLFKIINVFANFLILSDTLLFFYYKVRQVLLHGATILLQSAIGSTKYNRTVRVTEGKLTENV